MMPSSSDAAALAERRVPPRTTPATPAGPALLANHRKAAAGTSGRIFLALRGDISRVGTDGKPLVVGPPMKVTYRKLRLKVLPASGSEKD